MADEPMPLDQARPIVQQLAAQGRVWIHAEAALGAVIRAAGAAAEAEGRRVAAEEQIARANQRLSDIKAEIVHVDAAKKAEAERELVAVRDQIEAARRQQAEAEQALGELRKAVDARRAELATADNALTAKRQEWAQGQAEAEARLKETEARYQEFLATLPKDRAGAR